jgi:hypothetical protein
MSRRAAAAVMLAGAALSSCAMPPQRKAVEAEPEPEHPPALAPATLGAQHEVQQVLRVAFGEREATLRCVVVAHTDHLAVIVLNAMGQRLLSLDWDGIQWKTASAPMVPSQLHPQQLVADLQFALWPASALTAAYRGTGWDISEPGGGVRRLRHEGRLFAEVHYAGGDPWAGRLWMSNFRYGYALAIEPAAPPGP